MFRAVLLCFAVWWDHLKKRRFARFHGNSGCCPCGCQILVEYESENPYYQGQLEELPEYLRRFFDFRGGPPVPRARQDGVGFIITADGYVVTNNHVVANARQVVVRLPNRQNLMPRSLELTPAQTWQCSR